MSRVAANIAVHGRGIVALDKVDVVTVGFESPWHVLIAVAAHHGRPGDLVAVQVEDRQHCAVADRIEELDAFPGPFERPGLRLAIPDDGDGDQIRVIEGRAEGVREDVAELAALVNRAGCRTLA